MDHGDQLRPSSLVTPHKLANESVSTAEQNSKICEAQKEGSLNHILADDAVCIQVGVQRGSLCLRLLASSIAFQNPYHSIQAPMIFLVFPLKAEHTKKPPLNGAERCVDSPLPQLKIAAELYIHHSQPEPQLHSSPLSNYTSCPAALRLRILD